MSEASPMPPAGTDVRAAYQYCELVTKTQARNFSYGIMLLPRGKRQALSAVYAFARRIDDIGDGVLPAADKLVALASARAQVGQLAAGQQAAPGDPVLLALGDAARRYDIPLAAFDELIEGCEADVRGTVYRTWDDLEHYCRCVAGSIGRLSLGVFGSADPAVSESLADSLGVALQLTNILRDIREDLGNGRVYLPAEDLAAFGCTLDPGQGPEPGQHWPGDTAGLQRLIRFEAERARDWYATGLQLMPLLDWRSAASAGAMAGIYLRLLGHLAATPGQVLQTRMSLPTKEKLAVAAAALLGRTPRPPVRPAATSPAPAVPAAAGQVAQAAASPASPQAASSPAAAGPGANGAAAAGGAVRADGVAPSEGKSQADAVRRAAGGAP